MADHPQQQIFRSFPDIGELESASKFLHAYTKSEKLSLELCSTILLADPALYKELKEAHTSQNVEALDKLCAHLNRNAWLFHPRLSWINNRVRSIYSDGNLEAIVRGELKRPFWTPDNDDPHPAITDFIESLHIPPGEFVNAVPLVILHDLGSFQRNPKFRARLDRIFSSTNHTFLVNTSGTGKTKLLFEGLCLHWGFYLTCVLDSSFLGSGDFPSVVNGLNEHANWTRRLPSTSDANHAKYLQGNIQLVYRAVSETLLARLLVFKMYLEICSKHGFCPEQRQRWLESQIFPMDIEPSFDSFSMIKFIINDARLSDEDLDEGISHLLKEIQSIREIFDSDFLYIALDEANVASRKHEDAFEDQNGHYPILKEIVRTFRRRLGHLPIKFVIAGTMIPEEHFRSTDGEWDDFRWCSDTGFFDDPNEHRRYISQFMPPEFVGSVTGQALITRMWQWLRGRHRYTASFLAVLLYNEFQSPHTLLGVYIKRLAEYVPHDNEDYSEGEKFRYNDWYSALGSTGLRQKSLSTAEMHRAAIAFLSISKGCTDCPTTERILITEDYGYFTDPYCSRVALDEPLTVTYGAGWLKQNSYFSFAKFIRLFCKRKEVEVHPIHFAQFLALSLSSLLDRLRDISDVFQITGLHSSLPQAKLVTFTRIAERLETVDVHTWDDTFGELVFMASTPVEMISWFKHERREPFCILISSSSTSVILVFCLQLVDARCFWVFVKVSSTSSNDENLDFPQEIQDLHPNEVFRDKPEIVALLGNLPNLCLDVGNFGILRISGSCWPEKATKDTFSREEHPTGLLNIEGLDEADKIVSGDMFMCRLSRMIAQPKNNKATTSTTNTHKKGKKRVRSSTIMDHASSAITSSAGTVKTMKPSKGDVTYSSTTGARRIKSLKSSNAVVALPNNKLRKEHKDASSGNSPHRSQHTIGDVALGRASARVSRRDDLNMSSRYNLRMR